MPRGIAIGVFAVVDQLGFFRVPKLSLGALSQQFPLRLIDWVMFRAAVRRPELRRAFRKKVVCVKFSKLVVGAGVGSFHVNSDIPLFDRQDHPFAPTCPRAERRAQRQSRMPQAPAEPARSVLDRASTMLS
jgi:hypothetical protein